MERQHTDVEIRHVKYQIGRMKARDGSWVLAQLLTKLMPSFVETGMREAGLPSGRTAIGEADFASIQAIALSVCRKYNDDGIPMPVFVRPDKFAAPELEYDLVAVMRLTVESLSFNLMPFFEEGGLQILESFQTPGLLNSSASQT